MAKKIFISYRRADPDQVVSEFLDQKFSAAGFEVFRDVKTPIGTRWALEIQSALDTCDYFVILLSEQAMDRDMVRQETQRVHGLNQKLKKPVMLPVRLAYTGALPYDMAAWLDPLQYALWRDQTDNERIALELIAAINGIKGLPHQQARTSQDQKAFIEATEGVGRPLPKAEPVLDVIALSADNPFYIEREVDRWFYDSLRFDNGVATLHAPRQMGKSSLIARVRAQLPRDGMKSVFLDLKMVANESLNSAPEALEGLAGLIVEQLEVQTDPASFFRGKGFVGQKWQKFLVTAVAPVAKRVVLLFDDVDSLFHVSYRDAFFSCIRSVIDQKAQVPELQKIGFGFAHSHDPGLWIKMANQSPFNVAKVFNLPEFSKAEFDLLIQKHELCLPDQNATQKLFAMLGGHPYLTRLALFRLAKKDFTLEELEFDAATDEGLFGDHLRGRLVSIINAGLAKPFKSILDSGQCGDILEFQSLLAMGLVKGASHRQAAARFGLYQNYFQPRLDA